MKQAAYFAGGLILGLVLAAVIGWGLFPNYRYDHGPAGMRVDYQEEYIRLTAINYQLTGDVDKAIERLNALGADPAPAVLVSLTEQYIQAQRSERIIMPLVELAYALEVQTPVMINYIEE